MLETLDYTIRIGSTPITFSLKLRQVKQVRQVDMVTEISYFPEILTKVYDKLD